MIFVWILWDFLVWEMAMVGEDIGMQKWDLGTCSPWNVHMQTPLLGIVPRAQQVLCPEFDPQRLFASHLWVCVYFFVDLSMAYALLKLMLNVSSYCNIRRLACTCTIVYSVLATQSTYMHVWIKPATWLCFVLEIAFPISRSPQYSWWGLVLGKMRPMQWLTLYNI